MGARGFASGTVLAIVLAGCASDALTEHVTGTPPFDPERVASVDTRVFESGEFIAHDGTKLGYRLLPPASPQAGMRYPLVLQLHGSGRIGQDNERQLDAMAKAWALPSLRARYPAYVLVPQFPTRSADYDDPVNPRSAQASPALAAALELTDALARNRPVDRDRIYATGFSMGGSAAWLAPTLRPDLFAAIVPVSGIAPDDAHAGVLSQIPILVLHGDADGENPIDADRRMIASIQQKGGRQVRLREYAGLAHQPPGDYLPGPWWRDWLFAQRRAPPR